LFSEEKRSRGNLCGTHAKITLVSGCQYQDGVHFRTMIYDNDEEANLLLKKIAQEGLSILDQAQPP
jgi:hypothetical protein